MIYFADAKGNTKERSDPRKSLFYSYEAHKRMAAGLFLIDIQVYNYETSTIDLRMMKIEIENAV